MLRVIGLRVQDFGIRVLGLIGSEVKGSGFRI